MFTIGSMKKIRFIPILILMIFLVACGRNVENRDLTEIGVFPTPTIEATRSVVPGGAPDFQAQARQAFNLMDALRDTAFYRGLFGWANRFQVNEGAAVWIFILVTLVVAFNFNRFKTWRNLDLVLIMLPAIFLVNSIDLGNAPTESTAAIVFGFLYLCLFLSTLALFVRALMRMRDKKPEEFVPNLSKKILITLTIFFFSLNSYLALVRAPDDAGAYSNLGAYQLLKTGKFPYGNPNLRGGAAATYGPILYMAHIPYQMILRPIVDHLDASSVAYRIIVGNQTADFDGPPVLATKLALISLHLLAVVSLYYIGRRLANPTIGWALACLYVGSAYVMGLGGEQYFIGGVAYISHLAPAGITLLAFALLVADRPIWSGIVLALGAGAIYYPVFFLPAWVGYYFWKRSGWVKFTLAFTITCAIIAAGVLLFTQHGPNESALKVIYESTVGHQEAQNMYGSSTFSFWSTQPGLTAIWQKQLIEGWYLLRPSVIVFALFLVVTFFLARSRSLVQLAALTAAVAIGVQFWKSHAGGSYVEWYLPFFLIAVLAYPPAPPPGTQITPENLEKTETSPTPTGV
jgi:hypothetical protein